MSSRPASDVHRATAADHVSTTPRGSSMRHRSLAPHLLCLLTLLLGSGPGRADGDLDLTFGGGDGIASWTGDMFVEAIYNDLSRAATTARGAAR